MKSSHKLMALLTVLVAVISVAFGFKAGLATLGVAPFVFGMGLASDDVARYLIAIGLLDSAAGLKFSRVTVKTADYTIVTGTDPSGTLFTNRGAAGTVIFTLPAPAAAIAGVWYEFVAVVAAQTVTVKTATADTMIAFNDLTADSLSIATANEIIGGRMRATCDGTSWIVNGMSVAHTFTVAT